MYFSIVTVIVHFSDLRAKLEVAIGHVAELAKHQESYHTEESEYNSDSEDVSTSVLSVTSTCLLVISKWSIFS